MSGSRDQKWTALQEMWAGLGIFLFFFGVLVVLPMWQSWQHEQTKRTIVHACENRVELTIGDCVEQYKQAVQ